MGCGHFYCLQALGSAEGSASGYPHLCAYVDRKRIWLAGPRDISLLLRTMGADGWRKFLRWIHAGDLALDPSEKKAAAGLSIA